MLPSVASLQQQECSCPEESCIDTTIDEQGNPTIDNQGEIVSLLGPSGVGKTTILRTIAGLQKLNSGEIFLNNSEPI